jgi:hypothetical protein
MTNVVPGASLYLKFLKEQGIIEWGEYSSGRNSRMYRLTNEGKTEYRTITDQKLINRIAQNRSNILLRNSKKYPTLNKYIHKIEMDYEGAVKTVESEYLKNLKSGKDSAEGRRTYSLAAISKVESGEIYIKVNNTNGRLDSNYTGLPNELLKHLTIDGNPLVELDIQSSQPFFAACLLKPTPEMETLMQRFLGHSRFMSLKMLDVADYDDVKEYRLLVTTNEIGLYHYMWVKGKRQGIYFKTRKELKEQTFVVFFGADVHSPVERLFKTLFPNVQKVFDLIKQKKHNQLAIFLQRVESYTMLERVAKRIIEELPDVPFATRHDSILPALSSSIMVQADGIEAVEAIMKQTIEEITGLAPKIRVKTH